MSESLEVQISALEIEPGKHYILQTDGINYGELTRVADRVRTAWPVLDPPATFLIISGALTIEEQPRDYLELLAERIHRQIARQKADG